MNGKREAHHISTGAGVALGLGGLVVGGFAGFMVYGLWVRRATPAGLDTIASLAGRPGGVMCPTSSAPASSEAKKA